jgi:hypothetical protein
MCIRDREEGTTSANAAAANIRRFTVGYWHLVATAAADCGICLAPMLRGERTAQLACGVLWRFNQ